ncbi:hypothetical protein [Spirochaeta cellobiosiphila]|uniref:hypothetical protein n=1 Tax=Spirochaeta cellobiosiphila TaxID=504483 RepID=UPI00048E4DB4|nr:hypothetical protein [Spirochaeta cellobiosiphila]
MITSQDSIKLDTVIRVSNDEARRLKLFLSKTGRKRAPFVKTLLISSLEEWEKSSNLEKEV